MNIRKSKVYIFLISLFVCVTTLISAVVEARNIKFDMKVIVFPEQIVFILNLVCLAYRLRKSIL